ncbi:MAG: class I SAM-dependent methyltransferase [Candidatus Thorarchaeota archaeon]
MTGSGKEAEALKKEFGIRELRTLDIDRCFQEIGHSPKKILDVGHGYGAIANHYHLRGYEVTGIDVNPHLVDAASQNYPDVKFILYDGKTFPFEDSTFDTVILNDVLEHVSYTDMEVVLSEVRRVLISSGIIYISVMNRWQLIEPHSLIPMLTWLPRAAWHPVSRKLRKRDYIRYWPYTRGRLKRLLKKFNLEYKDLTHVYVYHKMHGINPVGDRITSKLMSVLKRLRLDSLAFYLALKVSVLLYVARK